jgi:hypothetical protein
VLRGNHHEASPIHVKRAAAFFGVKMMPTTGLEGLPKASESLKFRSFHFPVPFRCVSSKAIIFMELKPIERTYRGTARLNAELSIYFDTILGKIFGS